MLRARHPHGLGVMAPMTSAGAAAPRPPKPAGPLDVLRYSMLRCEAVVFMPPALAADDDDDAEAPPWRTIGGAAY